ncbi:hypothetical protein RF11_14904 [Thelohanellus kitauei]|uniref:Uncharacterized protein n=1 Tax=Thelohanellus kitauei TaxID=669202 RepID=A0A0C2J9Z6_THEKT|nr:hypothetical protein RF11_14904 [Thelohanellus kitauei]
MIESTHSMMRCSAESVPMVMSVRQKSLSILPTMPTMDRCSHCCCCCLVILPEVTKADRWSGHSFLKMSAPVKLPSPPITTSLVIPTLTIFRQAFLRPSSVIKSEHLAVPRIVPPI